MPNRKKIQFHDIIGIRIDKEVTNEEEHFYVCSHCTQSIDKRNLGEVFYHQRKKHKPLLNDS